MDYVRDHIKRYWGIAYRRTLGIALIALSVTLAMGISFSALRGSLTVSSSPAFIYFWILLAIIAIVTIVSSFFRSHVLSVRIMSDAEHKSHSKYMGLWMISGVLGVVAFLLPLLFVKSDIEPIFVLFTIGGVFGIIYITVRSIFKHHYNELAIGAIAFWAMFAFGYYQFVNASQSAYAANSNFAVYFAAMTITVISGFVGLALIINSSREALAEFGNMAMAKGIAKSNAPKARKR
jgi:hypothetical protein